MFEKLKDMAMQQLATKMEANSLSDTETKEAAAEGASELMDVLKSKIGNGQLNEVMALFSGGDLANNGVFAEAKSKLTEILQAKGMNVEEAGTEATNATSDVLNSLKDKFLSTSDADAGFNLEALTDLMPDGAADLLKNVDGADGLFNKAKSMFGK